MISIDDIQNAIAFVLPNYDVSEAYLYGSYARGEQTQGSDVDIRLMCGKSMTFSQLYDIQEKLEEYLGLPFDIATAPPGQMRPSFYNRIKDDEVLLYVA